METEPAPVDSGPPHTGRRRFCAGLSTWAMAAGLAGSYGTLAGYAGRFLYPSRARPMGWRFVAEVAALPPGRALAWQAPDGERVSIARRGEGDGAAAFVALSSTCPHLGCQVHWEPHNARFFCPCHNGVFTPEGVAVEGPPAAAGQALLRYELKVEQGLLYIRVPLERMA